MLVKEGCGLSIYVRDTHLTYTAAASMWWWWCIAAVVFTLALGISYVSGQRAAADDMVSVFIAHTTLS